VFPGYGIRTTLVDPEVDAVAGALEPGTGAVLVETVANPTVAVTDVRGIAALCAERGIPLVVDNSMPTPFLLRPAGLAEAAGAEVLVVHSTSKYIAGHSDLIGGSVACSAERLAPIRSLALEQGTTAGAFDAWLALRGVQTLALRMERQCANAMAVAEALDAHAKVAAVGYPGLASHPGRERAANLFEGGLFGAMLSFTLEGAYAAASRACGALRVARVGSSFGGMHTEVCHPATTSHRQLSSEDRAAAGISEGLIRCAVGAEDSRDLVADFEQALEKA
jgi:methionine-gamma-lyase